MRVRACYIDEIALASNALTNRGLTLSAIQQHHIEFVMNYNSKIILKQLCYVEYNFGAIYIKKSSIQSVPFCEV